MNPLKAFVGTLIAKDKSKEQINVPKSLYDIGINSLQSQPIDLSQFKGKKMLFVNVASKCGFTPQYRDLQKLHDTYNDKLVVIGIPCNQFGKQEPGTADEIDNFCQMNYGVSFTITEKINVKGNNQHPLYTWLTKKEHNNRYNSTVKWNFQKYLVDENGNLIDYFYSITKPMSSKITSYLKINPMFGLFKKTSELEKLQKQYEKLMADWHKLSTTNRAESEKKYAEAEKVLAKIDTLKEKF